MKKSLPKTMQHFHPLPLFLSLLIATPAWSNINNFMGAQMGLVGGLSETLKPHADHSPTNNSQRTGYATSGPLAGIYFGLFFTWRQLVTGIDTSYSFYIPFKDYKTDTEKSRQHIDFSFRVGFDIHQRYLPFFKLGYSVHQLKDNAGGTTNKYNFTPLHYGFGLDIKIIPEIVLGLEAFSTNTEESSFQQQKVKSFFNTFRFKLAWHI